MTVAGYGQTMTASAPSTVEEGDQFRLTYHIDTQFGLCKFAEVIKKNNIQSEIIEE